MLFKIATRTMLPTAAFLAGYEWAEHYFRSHSVPYPFEQYGLAVGLACSFWALGLVILAQTFLQKRRQGS